MIKINRSRRAQTIIFTTQFHHKLWSIRKERITYSNAAPDFKTRRGGWKQVVANRFHWIPWMRGECFFLNSAYCGFAGFCADLKRWFGRCGASVSQDEENKWPAKYHRRRHPFPSSYSFSHRKKLPPHHRIISIVVDNIKRPEMRMKREEKYNTETHNQRKTEQSSNRDH